MKDKNLNTTLKTIMQNPRDSDRTIAKKAGLSQPTITRLRHQLETLNHITYHADPNLHKNGLEILAITETDTTTTTILNSPEVIAAYQTPRSILTISAHPNYNAYVNFAQKIQQHTNAQILEAHIIDTEIGILKPYTTKNLPIGEN